MTEIPRWARSDSEQGEPTDQVPAVVRLPKRPPHKRDHDEPSPVATPTVLTGPDALPELADERGPLPGGEVLGYEDPDEEEWRRDGWRRQDSPARFLDPLSWGRIDGKPPHAGQDAYKRALPAAAKILSSAVLRWVVSRRDRGPESVPLDMRLLFLASNEGPHFITATGFTDPVDSESWMSDRPNRVAYVTGTLWVQPGQARRLQPIPLPIRIPDYVYNFLEGDALEVDRVCQLEGIILTGHQLLLGIQSDERGNFPDDACEALELAWGLDPMEPVERPAPPRFGDLEARRAWIEKRKELLEVSREAVEERKRQLEKSLAIVPPGNEAADWGLDFLLVQGPEVIYGEADRDYYLHDWIAPQTVGAPRLGRDNGESLRGSFMSGGFPLPSFMKEN